MIFADDIEIFGRVQRGLENGQIERLDSRRGATSDSVPEDGAEIVSTTSSELSLRVQAAAWQKWMGPTP